MPKKLLIFIIIVVLALIILGVLYYIGMPSQESMEKQNEITSMSLIRFPAGVEVTQETEGIEASTFKKGDLIKATGTIKFAEGKEKTVLTSQIFNKEGEKIGRELGYEEGWDAAHRPSPASATGRGPRAW